MKHFLLPVLFGLVAISLSVLVPEPVWAEGTVFYGGYGLDHVHCGSELLPCHTYDYARWQACNRSENEQDTYHVFHVVDGYISTCDMVGGSGREPRGVIERDWRGLLLSTVIPTVLIFGFSFIGSWLYYYQRNRRSK